MRNSHTKKSEVTFCSKCYLKYPSNCENHLRICPDVGISTFIKEKYLVTNLIKLVIDKKLPKQYYLNSFYLNGKTLDLINCQDGDKCLIKLNFNKEAYLYLSSYVWASSKLNTFEIGFPNILYKIFQELRIEILIAKKLPNITYSPAQNIYLYKYDGFNSEKSDMVPLCKTGGQNRVVSFYKKELVINNIIYEISLSLPLTENGLIVINESGKFLMFYSSFDNSKNVHNNLTMDANVEKSFFDKDGNLSKWVDPAMPREFYKIQNDTNIYFYLDQCSDLFQNIKPNFVTKILNNSRNNQNSSNYLKLSLGTVRKQFDDLQHLITTLLISDIKYLNCVLVYGPSGVGKTQLVREAVENYTFPPECRDKLNATIIHPYIDLERLETPADNLEMDENCDGDVKKYKFCQFLSEAHTSISKNLDKTVIVVIDNLHLISSNSSHGSSAPGDNAGIYAKTDFYGLLVAFITDTINKYSNCLLIGITNRLEAIDTDLRKPGRFDYDIEINAPTSKERMEIMIHLLETDFCDFVSDLALNMKYFEAVVKMISDKTHGFTGADLKSLITRAIIIFNKRYYNEAGHSPTKKYKFIEIDDYYTTSGPVVSFTFDAHCKSIMPTPSFEDINEINELRGIMLQDGDHDDDVDGQINNLEILISSVTPYLFKTTIIEALKYVKPSAMKEINLDIPEVKWCDIGGLESVKKELIKAIEWPLQHPFILKKMGIKHIDQGILLHGPPGCSKTMIARALATQSGLNFFSVKGPELFSKYVGESERMIRNIFAKAKAVSPSIIFFDEIDSLAVERSNDKNSSVGDRILTQLLTELDGIEQSGQVFVIAATNRIDKIDKALLRPGRLGKIINVPLPDADTRRAIFHITCNDMPFHATETEKDGLIEKTCGYSGAEIVALCQEAAMCALDENFSTSSVLIKHFDEALKLFDKTL